MANWDALRKVLQAASTGYLQGYVPAQQYNEGMARDEEQNQLAGLFRDKQFGLQEDRYNLDREQFDYQKETGNREYIANWYARQFPQPKPESPPTKQQIEGQYLQQMLQDPSFAKDYFLGREKPVAGKTEKTVSPGQRATGVKGVIEGKRKQEIYNTFDPNRESGPYDMNAPNIGFWDMSNPKAVDSGQVLYDLLSGGGQGGDTGDEELDLDAIEQALARQIQKELGQ